MKRGPVSRGDTRRPPPPKPGLAATIRSLVERQPVFVAAGALLLVFLVWAFWPSSYSRVTNLGSRGSSIIAFGDSLTAGFGAPAGGDYPAALSKQLGMTIVNAGVSGDTTESALARLEADVLSRSPRIVIVGLGGNDFLRRVPIASTEQNLRTIIGKIQEAGGMVVLLGFRFPSLTANYETMYERVADSTGCLLVGDILDGILSTPALKSDEIHPNAAGYSLMAERAAAPCRELIQKADAAR